MCGQDIKRRRRSQDGGGVGRGEHFLPHKFIKRAFKRRVNSTKQLLNAGRGHQAPRKAIQVFERRSSSNASIPTLKSSTTQGPTNSRARHTTQILQEHSPELQYTGCPKLLQNHWHNSLLDTSLHSREKKSSATHQNTDTSFPNQETLTSHLYNPTHSEETPQ